jgi:TolA-binding protein
MKKYVSFLIVFLLVFGISWIAMAEEESITLELWVDKQQAVVNGKQVTLDVPPTVVKGRTLVPLRFIGEALGAKVDYEAKARKITVVMENLVSLKNKLETIKNELAEAKEQHAAKVKELEQTIQEQTNVINQKTEEITTLQESVKQLETEITDLKASVTQLNEEIASLRKQLEESGVKEDTTPPVIKSQTVKDGLVISEALPLEFTIKDDSRIVFTRVKFGSLTISEDLNVFGTIKPESYVSGEYDLSLEALDAFANKTVFKVKVTIKNTAKAEPFKITTIAMDVSGAMMGGSTEETMAALMLNLTNKAVSNVEIMKIECFDKQGNLFEIMPGANLFDLIKMQFGLEHLWIQSKDKITIPIAYDLTNSGKKANEFFDGWKVFVTLYDSVMNKDFKLETTVTP